MFMDLGEGVGTVRRIRCGTLFVSGGMKVVSTGAGLGIREY